MARKRPKNGISTAVADTSESPPTYTLAEAAEKLSLNTSALYKRVNKRSAWPPNGIILDVIYPEKVGSGNTCLLFVRQVLGILDAQRAIKPPKFPSTFTLKEAASLLEVDKSTLFVRMNSYAWPPDLKVIRGWKQFGWNSHGDEDELVYVDASDVHNVVAARAEYDAKPQPHTLGELTNILRVCLSTIQENANDQAWPETDVVLHLELEYHRDAIGSWREMLVSSRRNVRELQRALGVVLTARHIVVIEGRECFSALYAAGYVGVAKPTFCNYHWRGCHLIGGEKLQPFHEKESMSLGRNGRTPSYFWAVEDLDRLNQVREAAFRKGWSGRGALPPGCLPPAGNDPSKAKEKITPPPSAETKVSTPASKATDGPWDEPKTAQYKWVYEQAFTKTPWGQIIRELKRLAPDKGWEPIDTIPGIRHVAKRYAEVFELPEIPIRKGGRRPK